jgi:2-polyprenyl-3-methyl-5-hydroxy-6-metoxy-1,4-benzoquinol methylase
MTTDDPRSLAGPGTHERAFELLASYLPDGGLVADLAAGEGAFTKMLLSAGYTVVAVDCDDRSWKVAGAPLVVKDLDSAFGNELAAEQERFDAVVAIEIIEHLENPFRFVRECSKLLKPNGLLMLTTPNVESVYSRLVFLYTGRLHSFGEYETVRPAHITPLFRWKLKMMLDEAGFEIVEEGFLPVVHLPAASLKIRLTKKIANLIDPLFKGSKGAESRIVVARLK